MASLNFPYLFSNNTTANAVEVNADLNAIKSFVETQVVQVDGSVKADTAAIADNAVTSAKIADNAVNTSEIADDAVTAAKVKDNETLPVNVSGSAGSVAWGNVSGKPAIGNVFNDGGTYSINVTGSAGSASYAGSAGSAGSAGYADNCDYAKRVYNAGAEISWNGSWWSVSQEFDFFGQVYFMSLGPSSVYDVCVLTSAGQVKKRTLNPWSLREMKEDIKEISSPLSKLKSIIPRSFRFKKDSLIEDDKFDEFDRRTQEQYGFVVDELLESDVPDVVIYQEQEDGSLKPQSWKPHAVISLAVAAIQELSDKVDALQAEVDALKNV
jgi:hypothetical protein